MRLIKKMCKQDAIYWPPDVVSDDYGQRTSVAPIDLKVRWEDTIQQMVDEKGTAFQSKAEVYVLQDVKLSGIMCQGKTTDAGIDLRVPMNNDGAYEIKKIDKIPTLSAKQFVRIVYL